MSASKPKKKHSGNSLVRSVAILASGTAFSQVILLASSPILTRLYTPDQFGLLAAYMAVVTIVGALATLRYELVIPLPRHDVVAANALALTLGSVAVFSLLSGIALLALGSRLSVPMHMEQLMPFAWLVPLGILSLGVYTAFNNWAVRKRQFGTITRTKLTQSISQTAIQIAAAFTPFATAGLLFGNLIGQSAGITSFARDFLAQSRATMRRLSWRRMWFLARHYRKFPLISLPASVAFSASQQAPSLIMMSMFGPATAGFYLLAQRVGMMPATLLGTAMSQSVYKDLAEKRKDVAALGRAVIVPVRAMTKLLIAPAVAMAVIAPPLVSLIFGQDWVQAGHYLRWMAPWVATTIIFGAMSPVVSITGMQVAGLVFQVSSLVVSAVAMYLAGQAWGPVPAIAAFSITKSLTIIAYRLQMLVQLDVRITKLALALMLQTILFIVTFAGPLILLRQTTDPLAIAAAIVLVVAGIASYAAINADYLRKVIRRVLRTV